MSLIEKLLVTNDRTIEKLVLNLAKYGIVLLPRTDLLGNDYHESKVTFPFDSAHLSRLVLCGVPGTELLQAAAQPGARELTIRHRAGFMARVADEPNDVSNLWHGKVVQNVRVTSSALCP